MTDQELANELCAATVAVDAAQRDFELAMERVSKAIDEVADRKVEWDKKKAEVKELQERWMKEAAKRSLEQLGSHVSLVDYNSRKPST